MIDIAFAGIGGYGNRNLQPFLDHPDASDFRIVAAIDPAPHRAARYDDLIRRRIPLFESLEAFFDAGRADLIVLSTPIHMHAQQTCDALSRRMNVLCEKPLCSTVLDAKRMAAAQRESGLHVAIGYQASFSQAVQRLKADIRKGRLGRPRRMKTIVLWPRDDRYYARNQWAGRQRAADGTLILDSPVNNACAHYLHNMFYLLGDRIDTSAVPERVTAELYRANPIQNYDTAAIRCHTTQGVEILFIVSHAIAETTHPTFCYEFEHATVVSENRSIVARFADGTIEDYGNPETDPDRKLWLTVDAVTRGEASICGIAAATPHTQCTWAAQHSAPRIAQFPESQVQITQSADARLISVKGLDEVLLACYERACLPTDLGVEWASPGKEVFITQTDNQTLDSE